MEASTIAVIVLVALFLGAMVAFMVVMNRPEKKK